MQNIGQNIDTLTIKSHTCDENGAHLKNFFLKFIGELEKQIIIKKTVEVGQLNKIFLLFTMLHFIKKIKEKHLQISSSKS